MIENVWSRIPDWYSRRPDVVLVAAGLAIVGLVASVTIFATSSADPGRSSVGERELDPQVDRLPPGVEVVEKGTYPGTDSEGKTLGNFGVLLENRGDSPVVMRVSFALFSTDEHREPWWEGPSGEEPLWVTIFPGEEVGLGDIPEPEERTDDPVGNIRVTGEADAEAASSLEAGSQLRADPVKLDSTGGDSYYSDLTFEVENGYDRAITDAGFATLYRDPESDDIVGGWYKRSIEDESVPDGVEAEYPEGASTHTVGVRNVPTAVDADDFEIYIWP